MLDTKSNVKKEIRERFAFMRNKMQAINKNIDNKYPDSGYVHEKLSKIRDETIEIQRLVNMLSKM